MRKFWFAIIDIVLLTAISYAENDETGTEIDSVDSDIVVGDMILSREQIDYLYKKNDSLRLAVSSPFKKWPSGIIYYEVDKSLDRKAQEVMIASMEYIENVSCVRFKVKDKTTKNYVLIKPGAACNSKVGMRRGAQPMIIDGNLCSKGSVIHELLHCLGFLHMHTAKNRNSYIEINWNNIQDDAAINFKQFVQAVSMYGTEYDYDSITHYSGTAFAKDKKKPTITAKKPAPNMGQRKEMSAGDIVRLNRMYNCPKFEEAPIAPSDSTTKRPTQFSNGEAIKRVELNKTTDNDDDLMVSTVSNDIEFNPNDTRSDDDMDDMILSEEQRDALYSLKSTKRNGLKSAFHHWPQGVVYFEIDPTFHPGFVYTIFEAMTYISNHSCIRFSPKTELTQNFVKITKGKGCSSEVGMRHTGSQLMSISEDLCTRGKIVHELLHSLGFLHMHTANERDDFISLNWSNIRENAKFNFKQFKAHVSMFDTPYDYDSIMHYSPTAFAVDRSKPTIIPRFPASRMGQREEMTDGDVKRLNRMYKCGPAYNPIEINPTTEYQPELNTSNPIEIVPTPNATENPKPNSTIFGILIFKIMRGT